MKPKVWKSGDADEEWKRYICKRDISRASRTLSHAEYVLGADLSLFTGAQIKEALKDYINSAKRSLR